MFLSDSEILNLVDSEAIKEVQPRLQDPFSRESPIQPCSIDLKIGRIFVPNATPDEPGGANNPKTEQHWLGPGHTAVVETLERFDLPENIGGFGFPPARVSRNGILMTNPGHIDPGYYGHMSFTLVNMGREPYALVPGQDICTVLLFRLGSSPAKDYRARGPNPISDRKLLLQKLSLDFLDVDERANETARKTVRDAELRLKNWQVWVPLVGGIVAVIVALLSLVLNITVFQSDLRRDVSILQRQLDVASLNEQVQKMEGDIEAIEAIIDTIQEQRNP